MSDEHALLAPSASPRWVPCSAAPELERLAGERPPTDDQIAGNAVHWVGASCLGACNRAPAAYVGSTDPAGTLITEDMAEAARQYVFRVRADALQGGTLYVEQRVGPSFHPKNWGTLDAALWRAGLRHLHVYDYKNGYKPVEIIDAWQLLNYAVLLLSDLGVGLTEHVSVTLTLVQPNAYHRDGPIRSVTLSAADLRPYANRLEAAANEATSGHTTARAGSWCYECDGRHLCKAAHVAAMSAFQFATDSAPMHLDPAALSAEYSTLLAAKRAVKERLTGIEAELTAQLERGAVVPTWTLDNPPGRLAWSRPIEDVVAYGDMQGVDVRKPEQILTATQAAAAGLKVDRYATRQAGSKKLVLKSSTLAARAFGDK